MPTILGFQMHASQAQEAGPLTDRDGQRPFLAVEPFSGELGRAKPSHLRPITVSPETCHCI